MGSSPNTALSPSIPLARRVINEMEEHQRTVLDSYTEVMDREMNTLPVLSLGKQQVKTKNTLTGPQPLDANAEVQDNTLQPESPEKEDTSIKQVDPVKVQNQDDEENAESAEIDASKQWAQVITKVSQAKEVQQELNQQDSEILKDQISRASQDDNYQTAIDEDEQDDTIKFGNPVTQPFLSRSVRVLIIEVGCFSLTQMLQDYLRAYQPLTHTDAYLQIQQMAQWLDIYLSKYPAQYINCMTSDSEFLAFVNHAIQLALVQTMHDYYNQ